MSSFSQTPFPPPPRVPAHPCSSLSPRGAGPAARRAVRPRPACLQARAAAARRSERTARAQRGEGRPRPGDPLGRPRSAGGAVRPASAQRSRWPRMETQRGRGAALAGARAATGAAPSPTRAPTRALPRAAGPAQWRRSAAGEHPPRVSLFGSPRAGEGRVLGCRRCESRRGDYADLKTSWQLKVSKCGLSAEIADFKLLRSPVL